jgi:hypothetical protein
MIEGFWFWLGKILAEFVVGLGLFLLMVGVLVVYVLYTDYKQRKKRKGIR